MEHTSTRSKSSSGPAILEYSRRLEDFLAETYAANDKKMTFDFRRSEKTAVLALPWKNDDQQHSHLQHSASRGKESQARDVSCGEAGTRIASNCAKEMPSSFANDGDESSALTAFLPNNHQN